MSELHQLRISTKIHVMSGIGGRQLKNDIGNQGLQVTLNKTQGERVGILGGWVQEE